MTRFVLDLSDMHAGGSLGLCNPDTVLIHEWDDGSILEENPLLTVTQEWLWRDYKECTAQALEIIGDHDLIVRHNGDATQGDQFNATIPGTDREDQRTIAAFNLKPLVELPNVKTVRMMTGTAIHVPDCAEARIARRLADETGKDIRCAHHSRQTIGGVAFDVSHHGPPPGSRDWLFGNVARYYLKDRIYRDRRMGVEPARVYLRGHYHRWVHETIHDRWQGETVDRHLIVLPALSGATSFWRKVGKSDPELDVGLALFEIDEGQLIHIHRLVKHWDLRTEEEL